MYYKYVYVMYIFSAGATKFAAAVTSYGWHHLVWGCLAFKGRLILHFSCLDSCYVGQPFWAVGIYMYIYIYIYI